jgi:hypothetical protein
MMQTLKLIGSAIRTGSKYLPIRMHAAALATQAGPKDYLGQVREVYNDATRRWRYVNDPFGAELLTFGAEALARYVLALDNRGVGLGRGAGDCDCIAAAVGAELMSIGRPIRLGVTAPPMFPPGRRFSHVFAQAHVPKVGWVTVDPVLYPDKPFGATTRHSRIAVFNLRGNLMGYAGNLA